MIRARAAARSRRASRLATASIALGVGLAGCDEGPELRRLTDAYFVRDAGEAGVIGPRDGSADSSSDAAPSDGSIAVADAGPTASACSVGAPVVLASIASGAAFAPVVASTGDEAVVAWIEDRLGVTDVYARRIALGGDADPELPLTDDPDVESGVALVATNAGYIVAFAHALLGGSDIRAFGFDATNGDVLGTTDATADVDSDLAPVLMDTANGPGLIWERTLVQAGAFRLGLTDSGNARDTPAESSASLAWESPYALDATSGSIRLYHRLDSTTLESIELDEDGLQLDPDAVPDTFEMPGYALGTRIRSTPANGTPRAVVVDANDGTNATALLQRIGSGGTAVGSPIEVALSDAPMAHAVTTYASRTVVAYRTAAASSAEIRLRAFRSTGSRSADVSLQALEVVGGALELITTADESAMVLVYDDVIEGVRELRVSFVTCTLP